MPESIESHATKKAIAVRCSTLEHRPPQRVSKG